MYPSSLAPRLAGIPARWYLGSLASRLAGIPARWHPGSLASRLTGFGVCHSLCPSLLACSPIQDVGTIYSRSHVLRSLLPFLSLTLSDYLCYEITLKILTIYAYHHASSLCWFGLCWWEYMVVWWWLCMTMILACSAACDIRKAKIQWPHGKFSRISTTVLVTKSVRRILKSLSRTSK